MPKGNATDTEPLFCLSRVHLATGTKYDARLSRFVKLNRSLAIWLFFF